jgi:hypothetical protein
LPQPLQICVREGLDSRAFRFTNPCDGEFHAISAIFPRQTTTDPAFTSIQLRAVIQTILT